MIYTVQDPLVIAWYSAISIRRTGVGSCVDSLVAE